MAGMKWIVCTALLLAAVGCGSNKSFQVELKNQTAQPVTLWLTKDGPPAEEGWFSPEQLGEMPKDARPGYDLAIVPPGKTGFTGKVAGEFPEGTNAVLRVYEGQLELFHILEAEKTGGAARADVPLKAGANKLRVTNVDGKLVVER